jgi:hypothetical protein
LVDGGRGRMGWMFGVLRRIEVNRIVLKAKNFIGISKKKTFRVW